MGRSIKWFVTSVVTIAVFGGSLWLGQFLSDRVLPDTWPEGNKIAAVIAFAALLGGTITFGIGKWWAEREPAKKPANTPAKTEQTIKGFLIGGGNGVSNSNINGDVTIGRSRKRHD